MLSFSPDGKSAVCTFNTGYYRGSLDAAGESYVVYLKKFGNWWFIVGGWEGGSWVWCWVVRSFQLQNGLFRH